MNATSMTEATRLQMIWPRARCCGATNDHCAAFTWSPLDRICGNCGHSQGCHAQ
jgi:hypothetical protein